MGSDGGTARDAIARREQDLIQLARLLSGTGRELDVVVRGTSMSATIPDGARVLIRCQPQEEIPIGAVISFVAGETLITHRLVYRGVHRNARRFVVTHGDGAWLCDPPCEVERIIGEARSWRENAGDAWRDVGTERRRPGLSGAASRGLRWAICAALESSVWLARGVFTAVYLPRRGFGLPTGGRTA